MSELGDLGRRLKDQALPTPLTVTPDPTTVTATAALPITQASQPLPTGAATETGNLATIATLAGAAAGDDLLRLVLIELRTITYYLQNGLNVDDEPSIIRNDPSILQ